MGNAKQQQTKTNHHKRIIRTIIPIRNNSPQNHGQSRTTNQEVGTNRILPRTMTTQTKKQWEQVSNTNTLDTLTLGPINTETLIKDPKHLAFTLSRYKFANKMLEEQDEIGEIGCGEGLGALFFQNKKYTGIDLDRKQIEYANTHVKKHSIGTPEFVCRDIIKAAYGRYHGLLCLDVIEHIAPINQADFLKHLHLMIEKGGVAIIGTPSKNASAYQSERSRIGHINLFTPERFQQTLREHFTQVFFFGMNDEVVHTGFADMNHYLLAVCIR